MLVARQARLICVLMVPERSIQPPQLRPRAGDHMTIIDITARQNHIGMESPYFHTPHSPVTPKKQQIKTQTNSLFVCVRVKKACVCMAVSGKLSREHVQSK